MQEPVPVPISSRTHIESYLKGKGSFAHAESDDKWIINGNPPAHDDIVVMIGKTEVVFSCNKPATEEFYEDEFRRYQEKAIRHGK